MCGRYALTLPPTVLREYYGYDDQPNFPPRYNIAPTQPIALVRLEEGRRRFSLARWGFLPGFVKDTHAFRMILNARAESVAEKPSFRAAFRRRRCIVMADGFYEWRTVGRTKRPFLIHRPNGGPLAFGGLWECWSSADGGEIDTACIITCTANGTMAAIHDRMPVILEPADFTRWLDPHAELKDIQPLLKPAGDDVLELTAVSSLVNKATNEGPLLQEPEGGPRLL